jgi:hypothetical protein
MASVMVVLGVRPAVVLGVMGSGCAGAGGFPADDSRVIVSGHHLLKIKKILFFGQSVELTRCTAKLRSRPLLERPFCALENVNDTYLRNG